MTIAVDRDLYAAPYTEPYTDPMAKRPMIGAQQARENFSDLLDAVAQRNEHPVVLRRSTPAGVFVPPDWYHQACELMGDPWDDWKPPMKRNARNRSGEGESTD
jgi:hypothetical protein